MIHKIWGHKKKIDEIVMMMGTRSSSFNDDADSACSEYGKAY